MQIPNALLLVLIGLGGHGVLAAPIPDLLDDALNYYTGGLYGQRAQQGAGQKGVAKAAQLWQGDTLTVSRFLSTAETMTPQQLQNQGAVALAAAKDELVQKAALDKVFLGAKAKDRDPNVVAADDALDRQGTFDFVVSALSLFAKRGASLMPDEVSTLVKALNQDRCPNVLPSVDAYLTAAAASSGGADARLVAVRPTNC